MKINHIYCGDAVQVLKNFPNESIDCCITSPPYYALRDYNNPYQIGIEKTVDEYVEKLLSVFFEVRRVLKKDGTFWLNLGDTYSYCLRGIGKNQVKTSMQLNNIGSYLNKNSSQNINLKSSNLKPKDLMGIPWTVALELRNKLGFYLRQDIIWVKPKIMPESVKDRCTKSHEYIFLLSKSRKYYFDSDAIKEKANEKSVLRYNYQFNTGIKEKMGAGRLNQHSNTEGIKNFTGYRNKRDVWVIVPKGYKRSPFCDIPTRISKTLYFSWLP